MRLASMAVDQAKYLENHFEERLGITDMHVPGEVGEVDRGFGSGDWANGGAPHETQVYFRPLLLGLP